MNRLSILDFKKEDKYLINANSGDYLFDLSLIKEKVNIEIARGSKIDLLLVNAKDDIDIEINIKEDAYLHLSLFDYNPTNSVKINVNVSQNGYFSSYFADFIPNKCKGEIHVHLNGRQSTCDWHLASLSEKQDNKQFDVNVYHHSPETFAYLDNYGVCRDNGRLLFSGICHIEKGSRASIARQNAKIMVFDEKSNGIAKPILKIDENDIQASHAAVVGKINDEHIFYLTSRGLTEVEAKRIITLGYLKPILVGFKDEDIKGQIEDVIEGKM